MAASTDLDLALAHHRKPTGPPLDDPPGVIDTRRGAQKSVQMVSAGSIDDSCEMRRRRDGESMSHLGPASSGCDVSVGGDDWRKI